MATAVKRKLSGSTDGMAVLIAQTATAGTLIHTAVAGTTPGTFDEVWIWATNSHLSDVVLTIEFGSDAVANNIKATIPYQAGMFICIPGLILQNGGTIKAFAGVANVISIFGFVNNITD